MKKKILGLDLGTNSIGWALIDADEKENQDIIDMGVRIIPLNSDAKTEFEKGMKISINQLRTKSRTSRKVYDRYQLRRSKLKQLLQEHDMYPNEQLFKLPMLELWKLRADSVSIKLLPQEIGRILFMLNQKRGYKSSRIQLKDKETQKKESDYLKAISDKTQLLNETKQTIGQYLYSELKFSVENNKYFQVKNKIFSREDYIAEFDSIMEKQKIFYPFLTSLFINQLKNETIFFQRKLKSQKGLLSICSLEGFEVKYKQENQTIEKTSIVGPKVTAKSSPINQICRIWENINNISLRVINLDGGRNKWKDKILTLEEKNNIYNFLSNNEQLQLSDLLDILKLKKEDVFANKQLKNGIKGNLTRIKIREILGESAELRFDLKTTESKHQAIIIDKKTGEILETKDAVQIDKNIKKEPLYQIWHTIYSIKDELECKNVLIKKFNFEEAKADKLSKIDLEVGAYANKSSKAIRKIIPYLMEGYNYYEATCLAGYNLKKEQSQLKDKLELLPKNSLRQPVVEKIVNQLVNVVNGIISEYGKPDEIRIELARELKQNIDERNESFRQNTDTNNLHKEIEKKLKEEEIPVTKKNIQKYKFIFPSLDSKKLKDAKVLNQCIYCGGSFGLQKAIGGDEFDIDHIIPKALLFDDSQSNKVLVHRRCNQEKGDNTAFDYIRRKKSNQEFEEYQIRIDQWYKLKIISYGKKMRLEESYEDYMERKKHKKQTKKDIFFWENFISRQLRETQYITIKAKEILSQICENITTSEGSVTALLRQMWGWNNVLLNLQIPKYKNLELTSIRKWTSNYGSNNHQIEEITDWSKRDDHRHHAIDALVVACTKQGFIQRINTLNASDIRAEMLREIEESKKEFNEKRTLLEKYLILKAPFNTKKVEEYTSKILISYKSGKRAATIGSRKIKINGKKTIVQNKIIIPRGELHEQSTYGKIKIIEKNIPLSELFKNPDLIISTKIKQLIKQRLEQFENNHERANNYTKKNPIFIDSNNFLPLENANCFKEVTVKKYPINNIKINQIDDIIDEGVKILVQNRLLENNNNLKEAFKKTIWLNEEKQIPINSIRINARPKNLVPIKKDENGKEIGFVLTGNNHHLAIYKNNITGNLVEHVCTFWNAVERKKFNLPIIIENTNTTWNYIFESNLHLNNAFCEKIPDDGHTLIISLQQNEMIVLGLTQEAFTDAFSTNNFSLISEHLYTVWSISSNDYYFKHHLETKNTELKQVELAKTSKRFYRIKSISAFLNLNPIKIRLNHIGKITKIHQ